MNKFIILFFIIFSFCYSEVIYVDSALVSDCTSDDYSIENRNCEGSDGDAYDTIQEALDAMSTGDSILIRDGTYQEANIVIPRNVNGNAWTKGNFNTLCSYPGEWAIIDCNHSCSSYEGMGLGYPMHTGQGDGLCYWIFERFELKNADSGGEDPTYACGLWAGLGPVILRYLYIHDCQGGESGNNPAGFKSSQMRNSLIEYCHFEDNGYNAQASSANCAHIAVYSGWYVYGNDRADFDMDYCTQNNIIRYNLFESDGTTFVGFKHKGREYMATDESDYTYEDYCDSIYCNLFIGDFEEPVMVRQDFCQVMHNIFTNDDSDDNGNEWQLGELSSSSPRVFHITCYNNTSMQACYKANEQRLSGPSSITNTVSIQNNVVTNFDRDQDYRARSISLYSDCQALDTDSITYSAPVTNNLIHSPDQSDHFMWGYTGDYALTTTEFDSRFSSTNYTNSTANLFKAESGYQRLILDPTFVVSGETTIANGGSGAAHPFLDGVTLPSYIGADSSMVQVVSDSVSLISWLQAQSGEYYPSSPSQPEQGTSTAPVDSVWAQ